MTQFFVAAHGLISNNDGKFLVTKRPDNDDYMPGKWDIPGGTVEAAETPEFTLTREIREEVGLTATLCKVDYVATNLEPLPERQYVILIFRTVVQDSAPIMLNINEHVEYRWVTLDEMLELDLIPFVRQYAEFCKQYSIAYAYAPYIGIDMKKKI